MITLTAFKGRFPEHVSTADHIINMSIEDAVLVMSSEAKWGNKYEIAQMYLTAHFLTVALHTGSGDSTTLAPVKGQEVDDVSIDLAVTPSASFDDFNSTAYGQRYVMYRRMALTGPRVV